MQIYYAYYCNCSFVCLFLTTYKCKRLHLNSVKTGDDIQVVPKKMRWSSVRNLMCVGRYGFSGKILGDWNKKHKNSLIAPPSYEVDGIAKRIKTSAFGEKSIPVGTWYFTSAHNYGTILNINHLAQTRSIASLPCKIIFEIDTTSYQEIILIIRGFSPWNGERFLSLGQSG